MIEYIVMPAEIESIMSNWERWSRDRKHSPASCKSLESRWKSPQVWQGMQPYCEVDLFEALAVEKIICQLPDKNKKAIKAWHIARMPPHVMRRRIAVHDVRELMMQSWSMIINNLHKLQKPDIIKADVTESGIAESAALLAA